MRKNNYSAHGIKRKVMAKFCFLWGITKKLLQVLFPCFLK